MLPLTHIPSGAVPEADAQSYRAALAADWAALEAGLRLARHALWLARLRASCTAGVEGAIVVACVTAVGLGAMKVLASVGSLSPAWRFGWITLGSLGTVAAFSRSAKFAAFGRPPLGEVAERLDIAAGTGNRIATAEELLRSGPSTTFETAAVASGLEQLNQVWQATPLLPTASFRLGRCVAVVAISAVATAVMLAWPPTHRYEASGGGSVPGAVNVMPDGGRADDATSHGREESPVHRLAANGVSPSASPPSGDGALTQSAKAQQSSASALDNSATTLAGGDASASGSPQNANRSGVATVDATPAGTGHLPTAQALRPAQERAPAASTDHGVDGAPRASKPGSLRPKPAPARAGTGKPLQDGQPGSVYGSSPAPSDTPPPPPDAGDAVGSGAETDQPLPPSAGSSMTPTHSDQAGGDGKTLGESARPKKSRGVAPQLLGTRQPDLFQARPLAGPDERTKTQLPPRFDPGVPAPSAAAADRDGDERPVAASQVPADLRGVVGQYFQQFHADAASASAAKHE